MIKKILIEPNPILRKKSQTVAKIDGTILRLAKDLQETLEAEELGVGLAAPQIGVNLRVFAMRVKEIKDSEGKVIQKEIPFTVFINPELTKLSKEKTAADEGCLSFPGYFGELERAKKVKMEALDLDGKTIKMNASGFVARIFQHEIDHLNGILFFDRMKDTQNLRKLDVNASKKITRQ